MKVKVAVTLDIPAGYMRKLSELAADSQVTTGGVRAFLNMEAEEHLVTYLEGNNIKVKVVK